MLKKSLPFCLTFLFCCYVLNFDIAKIIRNARFHAEISLVKKSSDKSNKFVTFAVNYQTLASGINFNLKNYLAVKKTN